MSSAKATQQGTSLYGACSKCRRLSDNLTNANHTLCLLESTFSKNLLSRTVMLDNKGKKDKSKVIRRPTPTAPHRPPINTSSNHLELVAGRGNLQQRSLSPANSSRPHPALASLPNRSKPGHASPSTAASWRSPSSAPTPDLSPHAKTKALGGHKSKTGSGANPEIMKRSLR